MNLYASVIRDIRALPRTFLLDKRQNRCYADTNIRRERRSVIDRIRMYMHLRAGMTGACVRLRLD